MTSNQFWKQIDLLANEEITPEREIVFLNLLKQAYDEDLKLIIACTFDPFNSGLARQGYMEVLGKRMMVCFTSKERAKKAEYGMEWSIAKARDVMNNMFNKEVIMGMVFNPNDEKMFIVPKEILNEIMPGDKPKPWGFTESF